MPQIKGYKNAMKINGKKLSKIIELSSKEAECLNKLFPESKII